MCLSDDLRDGGLDDGDSGIDVFTSRRADHWDLRRGGNSSIGWNCRLSGVGIYLLAGWARRSNCVLGRINCDSICNTRCRSDVLFRGWVTLAWIGAKRSRVGMMAIGARTASSSSLGGLFRTNSDCDGVWLLSHSDSGGWLAAALAVS